MQDFIEFWIYELWLDTTEHDWVEDKEKAVSKLVTSKVLDDCSDNICIGGNGKDNKYYQFDSYEAYYASSYFTVEYNAHGLRIECRKVRVNKEDMKCV
jgi:hypothetical protein